MAFVILNLFILATLLLVHTLLAPYWGFPTATLISILVVAIFALGAELFWLVARSTPLTLNGMALLTSASICFNILLAILMGGVTNREDTEYFVILVVPVLVAAFRLTLPSALAVIAVVD